MIHYIKLKQVDLLSGEEKLPKESDLSLTCHHKLGSSFLLQVKELSSMEHLQQTACVHAGVNHDEHY